MTGGSLTKWFVFMSGMILIVISCNTQPEPAPKPKVVSKKIAVPENPELSQKPEAASPKKTDVAATKKLPVSGSKPIAPVEETVDDKPLAKAPSPEEQKTEPASSQKATANVENKADKKPEMVISETANGGAVRRVVVQRKTGKAAKGYAVGQIVIHSLVAQVVPALEQKHLEHRKRRIGRIANCILVST